jgi:inhibitor of KinA
MTSAVPAYRIFPLGDAAITIDFGNVIDEKINNIVIQLFSDLKTNPLPGMIECVPAYSSIAVYYDIFTIARTLTVESSVYDFISGLLTERLNQPLKENAGSIRLIKIPVCYEDEFAPDIKELAAKKNISVEEVIAIHSSRQYRVYMLGFLPGFSYMGEVDERISIARKIQPKSVVAGSIGIAGRQTGIYPAASPGGWQIIGRTPLKLFDAEKEEPTLLKAGDTVQFISISQNDFIEIQNSPLHFWRGAGGEV